MISRRPGAVLLLGAGLGLGAAGLSAEVGPAPAAPSVRFTEVTEAAGLNWTHHDFGDPAKKYIVETMGPGAALFDYDGDGWLDVYLVDGSPRELLGQEGTGQSRLYRNRGDATFEDVTERSGLGKTGYAQGVAVEDYDRDGDLDVYVTHYGPDRLYRNEGGGRFTDVTQEAGLGNPLWGSSATFLDYDRDGDADLYVANYLDFTPERSPFCGDKVRGIVAYCSPQKFAGVPDVLYRNEGNGRYTDVTKEAGALLPDGRSLGVAAGDFDLDGDTDLYVANDQSPNHLLQNNGNGTFTESGLVGGAAYSPKGVVRGGMGVAVADENADGWFDILVTNFSSEANGLFRGMGALLFQDEASAAGLEQPSWPWVGFGVGFLDADHDGDEDLLVVNGHVVDNIELFNPEERYRQKAQLFLGANGRYTEARGAGAFFEEPIAGRGAAFGDVDNDGDVDVLVTENKGRARLLRNDGGGAGHWLGLQLRGKKSPTSGLGARVTLQAGGRRWIKEVRGGSSYLCHNDLRLHFGLGAAAQADAIEVLWPSGSVSRLTGVKAGQYVTVHED